MLVACIDPSLRGFGMAKLDLDLKAMTFTRVVAMELVETEKETGKKVRQNSDDLRRSRQIVKAFHAFVKDVPVVFAEVPSGAQSARAALSFGISIGILAACPKPLIQVMPAETKLATVGTRTASKEEMIEWATEHFPDAPWFRHKHKGVMKLTDKNEHLADAVAIGHAGIVTDQFLQLLALLRQAA